MKIHCDLLNIFLLIQFLFSGRVKRKNARKAAGGGAANEEEEDDD